MDEVHDSAFKAIASDPAVRTKIEFLIGLSVIFIILPCLLFGAHIMTLPSTWEANARRANMIQEAADAAAAAGDTTAADEHHDGAQSAFHFELQAARNSSFPAGSAGAPASFGAVHAGNAGAGAHAAAAGRKPHGSPFARLDDGRISNTNSGVHLADDDAISIHAGTVDPSPDAHQRPADGHAASKHSSNLSVASLPLLNPKPARILRWLNTAFLAIMGVLLATSIVRWGVAAQYDFMIEESVAAYNESTIPVVLYALQVFAEGFYFLASVWMKHSLVQSLPASSEHALATTCVSVFLAVSAIGPIIPTMFSRTRSLWTSIATVILGLSMCIIAWFYVFLSVTYIKLPSATFWNAIQVIRTHKALNFWLIQRPLIMFVVSTPAIINVAIHRIPLELGGYIGFIVVCDFIYEYKQIEEGLFASLIRQVGLPPSLRTHLDKLDHERKAVQFQMYQNHMNRSADAPSATTGTATTGSSAGSAVSESAGGWSASAGSAESIVDHAHAGQYTSQANAKPYANANANSNANVASGYGATQHHDAQLSHQQANPFADQDMPQSRRQPGMTSPTTVHLHRVVVDAGFNAMAQSPSASSDARSRPYEGIQLSALPPRPQPAATHDYNNYNNGSTVARCWCRRLRHTRLARRRRHRCCGQTPRTLVHRRLFQRRRPWRSFRPTLVPLGRLRVHTSSSSSSSRHTS
ncbi:hypothetical protein BC831DRAFT_454037, partial [Entophlyctis helioformis]